MCAAEAERDEHSDQTDNTRSVSLEDLTAHPHLISANISNQELRTNLLKQLRIKSFFSESLGI